MAELAGQPAAGDGGEERRTVAVDDWQPEADAAASEGQAFVQGVVERKQRRITLEPELACTAREVARFYAAHEAFPDQQLQAYMAGVCGATAPTYGISVWATPNDTLTTAANRTQWHEGIEKQLGQWLPAEAAQAGGAEVTDGKNTVFASVVATAPIDWESKNVFVNANGEVELTGSVRTSAGMIFGLSNVGAHGVQECRTDPRVAAPRFHITCKLAEGDDAAWVDVEALPPGRVLARGVARLLIRREGFTPVFAPAGKASAAEKVTSPVAFSQRLLALVNEARATANLRPVKLSTRQSETSAKLAPHYFKKGEAEANVTDQIALGMLAGWDVQGTIRSGEFYSAMLSGSLDPRRWLAYMLEQPSARRVLLDPAARTIAIGPEVRAAQQTVGALISTYAFYESDDHRADVEQFLARLNEHRRGLGLSPVKVTNAPELTREVQGVKKSHDPEDALNAALSQVVSRQQRGVEGFYIEATDLAYVSFPEALLRPSVTLAVSAAHHRYPDAAWGTLTLLVAVLESSGRQQTAAAAATQHVE